MKKYLLVVVFIPTLLHGSLACMSGALQIELRHLTSRKTPRIFLLSYPRSGNSWLRYCIEFLTGRATFSRAGFMQPINQPFAWHFGFELNAAKEPVEKLHRPKEIQGAMNQGHDKLLFILRNPKETFARYERSSFDELLRDCHAGRSYAGSYYFEDLEYFDAWPDSSKLLIYYEDLIQHPETTLKKVLDFLGESADRLCDFMHSYDQHKKACVDLYYIAESKDDTAYHTKRLSAAYLRRVDQWISQAYPNLWNRYLIRYAEQ